MGILGFARVATLAGAASLGFASAAAAQEGVFMKDFLGSIGIIPKERPAIDYRERAPLVLPPKMELREPAGPAALRPATRNGRPTPKSSRRARREADARMPVTETEARRMDRTRRSRPRDPAGPAPRRRGADGPVVRRGDNSRDELLVRPDELRGEEQGRDGARRWTSRTAPA